MHRPDRAGSRNASLLRLQEEFELRMVEFETVEGTPSAQPGMLCVASSDEAYVQQWGSARFDRLYTEQAVHFTYTCTITGAPLNSTACIQSRWGGAPPIRPLSPAPKLPPPISPPRLNHPALLRAAPSTRLLLPRLCYCSTYTTTSILLLHDYTAACPCPRCSLELVE